jgi:hypothetical protein
MHEWRRVWLCVPVLIAVPLVVFGSVTAEHFNYGDTAQPLTGLNGGENWGGSWGGYDNLSPAYDPGAGLSYTSPHYSNGSWELHEGNDPLQGGTVHQSYRGAPRSFPSELTGTVWVSVLVRLGENQTFRGFTLENNSLTFGFGFDSDCAPCAFFAGCDTIAGADGYSTVATHLVLGRVEFDYNEQEHDRICVWADPEDECGLGIPDALIEGFDVASGWGTLMFELGNGSNVDAIRVSHGPDACLDEVLYDRCPSTAEPKSWSAVKALFR